MSMQVEAERNLEDLGRKSYTGRGLVLGMTPSGKLAEVYWLKGRSGNSRNRVLAAKGGKVWTEAADPTKVQDPSLIIYTAMDERDGMYVVSNGDQTNTVMQFGQSKTEFRRSMETREFEPDSPNFTPRITGVIWASRESAHSYAISVLRRQEDGSCRRSFFQYDHSDNLDGIFEIVRGTGRCVTTYTGEDVNPLPSFVGDPYPVPLLDTMGGIMEMFRSRLENEHFISIAVKLIDPATGESRVQIYNRYEKVS